MFTLCRPRGNRYYPAWKITVFIGVAYSMFRTFEIVIDNGLL